MKYILFIVLGFFVAGCETLPENSEKWMEREQNACLPTAISFREGLKKYDLWAEVVSYRYIDYKTKKLKGHSIVAYMYPPGKNQMWTYDYEGSWRTRAWKEDALMIATQAEKIRGRWDNEIIYAEFQK
jgi:hypothetical protein